ncbi:unnamed protein product [Angiostrongylus costaricensis]|uniref:DNA-directed primase/polymerase protein n=1 Tax=Angiostrongylus costaricensis TaxID=334426 RepID=A0A0R3PN17_ANGCS|nr:unnamed protein product [Angiostrongylus costaricensis]
MHSKLATTTSDSDPEDSFNDVVHLDDSWFYGPPRKKQVLNCTTKENLIPSTLVNPKRPSLVEKSFGEMETFSKQRSAIGKLEESVKVFKNSRIFSFEKPEQTNGERRYLVSTLERFWSWYETLKDRHFYELITESSPCRLYFDLEYSKATNANIDHEAAYNYFMNTVRRLLHDEFDIEAEPAKDFLVLDSSTESKFSAHVICHLPNGYLFPSNARSCFHCGLFFETVLFDNSVYTKNRNFRLFLSSKLGKNTIFKRYEFLFEENQSYYLGSKKPSDRQVFYDSICIPANASEFPLLGMKDIIGNELQRFHGIQCREFNLYLTLYHVRNLCLDPAKYSSVKLREGSGPSPYIQLDEFMLMLWKKWNPSAYIRQWKVVNDSSEERVAAIIYYVFTDEFREEEVRCAQEVGQMANFKGVLTISIVLFLEYGPANCRYCFNIGREHKSNGTFWTVNLSR